MIAAHSQGSWLRGWAVLALAAILFRALIPVGYMAVVDSKSGVIEVTMCSGAGGHETVSVEAPTNVQRPGDAPVQDLTDNACPFAMAAAPVLPEANAFATADAIYEFEYALAAIPTAVAFVAWSPHAPPTGPPTLI